MLPEIPVECDSDGKDDDCVDDIPLVPACTCFCLLLRCCRTEYKSLDLLRCRSLCAETDNDDHDDAEEEHPSAEEEPVHIIEDIFEELNNGKYLPCSSGLNEYIVTPKLDTKVFKSL